MAIKVKATERNVSFDKTTEKWAYVLTTELYKCMRPFLLFLQALFCAPFQKVVSRFHTSALRQPRGTSADFERKDWDRYSLRSLSKIRLQNVLKQRNSTFGMGEVVATKRYLFHLTC